MNRFFAVILFILIASWCFAQNQHNNLDRNMPETYVVTTLNQQELQRVSERFSIDRVSRNADGDYTVRICVAKKDYAAFEALNYPFSISTPAKANVSMATTYAQLVQSWNKYPTYSTYMDAMRTFQTQFPDLCKIDTILANTPGGHALLVAHISNTLNDRGTKPSFFYTSTMHGDEPVGYVMMLHLIHDLLNNYETDANVRYLVDNVDLWICPLENPDGTYHMSDNVLNQSPTSTRYNYNEEDLNRSYPWAGRAETRPSYEPEVQAMMLFGAAHPFVMSANMHGGAEVVNYPWDIWGSNQRPHADTQWWKRESRMFADTCHKQSNWYMHDLSNGVTQGADWYAITGSRQDYFNYYLHCREFTLELSTEKVVSSNTLPTYWNYMRSSLLNYIKESLYGFSGVVTDSVTGAPIEAMVFVENHDCDNSFVYSHLPAGDYHRPIKGGIYEVTFSAQGYYPKTLTMSVYDGQTLVQNVALVPILDEVEDRMQEVRVYPNPTNDNVQIRNSMCKIDRVEVYDMMGRMVKSETADDYSMVMDVKDCVPGQYMLRIVTGKGTRMEKIMVTKKR